MGDAQDGGWSPPAQRNPPALRTLIPATTTILVLLGNLVARSGPTPEALTPASTPVPTAAAMPTEKAATARAATAASSKVPEPAKTPTPDGKLVTLRLRDSKVRQSALSDTELACIGGGPGELARALAGPGPASQGEQDKLFGCLNDETLATIFLTGLVPGSEPLSEVTSDCCRAAFEVTDPREVMTSGIYGEPERAMAESMTTLSVTMACLDDEELVSQIVDIGPVMVLLEATGGLEVPLVAALAAAALPVVVVNPRQVRDFARATGTLAKTDSLDATVLAHFADAVRPSVRPLRDAETQVLNSLAARRHQVLSMLVSEKNRLGTAISAVYPASRSTSPGWNRS